MKKLGNSVDEYISGQSKEAQVLLKQLRSIIVKTAPKANEVLSYHMPAYKYHGMLLYFAAHKNHVGLYPMPSALKQFQKELVGYKTSKSTIQFPLDKKLPVMLIKKIVKFRVRENEIKSKKA